MSKRWIIVAITTGGEDVLLNWSEDLNEFIGGLCGEDIGLVVPQGIGRGVFHVSDVKVYGPEEGDECSAEEISLEGAWLKVFDYDAAFDDVGSAPPPADPVKADGDVSSLIAARCSALPGKLIDCPVCGAVDKERDRQEADVERLVGATIGLIQAYVALAETSGVYDSVDRAAGSHLNHARAAIALFAPVGGDTTTADDGEG